MYREWKDRHVNEETDIDKVKRQGYGEEEGIHRVKRQIDNEEGGSTQ
jgi:hypothetical protein